VTDVGLDSTDRYWEAESELSNSNKIGLAAASLLLVLQTGNLLRISKLHSDEMIAGSGRKRVGLHGQNDMLIKERTYFLYASRIMVECTSIM
jgi:hypothetical protein